MKIAVIGAGYVGLVSATCFAELGHDVICLDIDERKISLLRDGQVPIFEQHLPELVARHLRRRLHFSTDIVTSCKESDVVFICVGTPPADTGEADLSFVENVARELVSCLDGHKIIVEKSTVPVGTCEAISRTMLLCGAEAQTFSIASNPEFLREGTAVTDFLYPDRILVGVTDETSRSTLMEIYKPILDGSYRERPDALVPVSIQQTPDMIITSVKSAELIKHASNAFLALKISFINSVANVCERVGANVREVALGMGKDSRIGPQFLNAGIGFGGSCFPKDVMAFRSVAASVRYDFSILTEVMRVNDEQRRHFLRIVRQALWNSKGKKLAALGLAFKSGTDDCRESSAIEMIKMLAAEGASRTVFDPVAMERAKTYLPDYLVTHANNPYEACKGADCLLILTEWPEFAGLDWFRVRNLLRLPIVVDGRNILDPSSLHAAGLRYYGVGWTPDALNNEVAHSNDLQRRSSADPRKVVPAGLV